MAKKTNTGMAGIAALAAAAAGAYFFLTSPKVKTARNKAHKTALAAKKEIVRNLSKLKTVTQKNYQELVKQALQKYNEAEKDFGPELKKLSTELMGHWKNIEKEVKKRTAKTLTTKAPKKAKSKTRKKA